MNNAQRIAVLGANGFVGSATVDALTARGHTVIPVKAPRLPNLRRPTAADYIRSHPDQIRTLEERFETVDAVVNAAGCPNATSGGSTQLVAANGVLPGLIATACQAAGVRRFVHVSSASVQGRRPILDDTLFFDDFSDYSSSKRLGEELVRRFGDRSAIIYRPPGVHGFDRSVTRLTARVAASPLASVAKPFSTPSPQALIQNVADAIAYLATSVTPPPPVVIHPWEGLTTGDVMRLLGGRPPTSLPRPLAQGAVAMARTVGRIIPAVAGHARRIEMMWFGQKQASSWLETVGWRPPADRSAWVALGDAIRNHKPQDNSTGSTRA